MDRKAGFGFGPDVAVVVDEDGLADESLVEVPAGPSSPLSSSPPSSSFESSPPVVFVFVFVFV